MNKAIIVFLLSISSFAYIPTVESVLKNNSNPDVASTTVAANLILERINEEEKSEENDPFEKILFKIVSYQDDSNKIFTQLNYKNTFSKNSLREVVSIGSLDIENFIKNTTVFSQGVFYGVLKVLLRNDSQLLIQSMRNIGINIKTNKELINKPKVDLINRYKEYLNLVKKDPDLEKSLDNPLSPQDEDLKKTVSEIINQPFYIQDENINLVKRNNSFYWQYDAGNANFIVSNETRELRNIKVFLNQQENEINLQDYILFNGTHSFPRRVVINYLGKKYKLTLEKLTHFTESIDQYRKRLIRYEKEVTDANPDKVILKKPQFLM